MPSVGSRMFTTEPRGGGSLARPGRGLERGGVIVPAGAEPAYPPLGMGRAARARYPEAWDVSRP